MTFGEILAQLMSEITKIPASKILDVITAIAKAHPGKQRFDEVVPDDKVEELLEELRKGKPAIIAQLMGYSMASDRESVGHA